MGVDRRYFFDCARAEIFGGRLRAKQVEGVSAILDGWEKRAPEGDRQALAYVLATAFHETAGTMQPVRETLARTDAAAIARLEKAYASGRLRSVRTPYWWPDAEGKSWLGRGLVQLTHRRNYEAMSKLTGVDLVADPARAMELEISVTILIEGMRAGSFTGLKLGNYFGPGRSDWLGARRIINGTDRAELVAGHGKAFCRALAGV
ncbi:glycoside hydrolase family 19 protein [Rhizobium sp. LC145]|uniref:glycoside hydrolase family 19 protein n=1 Tax=Rhizobium sp. LC145 TaxID=1120688 RepID=UPI00062A1FFB|nr:glycoside hydrolase family 19 protein [Rhizobium sp. LC145]KKX28065.1 chitinase [Rhizobium sp. LC145]TKT43056.1 hypothetical protein FDR95_27610 [Rhizobiaceae bacterium LC148]